MNSEKSTKRSLITLDPFPKRNRSVITFDFSNSSDNNLNLEIQKSTIKIFKNSSLIPLNQQLIFLFTCKVFLKPQFYFKFFFAAWMKCLAISFHYYFFVFRLIEINKWETIYVAGLMMLPNFRWYLTDT